MTRRHLLKTGGLAAVAAMIPRPLLAAATASAAPERHLSFFNTHTGESLETLYAIKCAYVPEALKDINHILRDFRLNEVKPIDPGLLDLLHLLTETLDTRQPLHIISGYRSPHTNAMLRQRGGAQTGVASHSLHMDGKAADIRVPGTPLATLKRVATSLKIGGVGYYPDLDFVHVDVGRVRYW